jgi:hypothetical protein
VGHDTRQQRAAPDHADDDPDQQLNGAAVEQPACEQIRRVAKNNATRTDRVRVRRRDQPGSDPADHDHDQRHEREPARASQRDEHAHEHEGDRVVDQVLKARVQERRGEDPPQSPNVARIDPVGAEPVRVDRVEDLDHPHQRDDRDQQPEALALGLAPHRLADT